MRSWELVARYVMPELNGYTVRMRESQQYLHDHQAELMGGATRAVMSKILAHEGAAAAMATTMEQMAQRAADEQTEFRPGAGLPSSAD
jgi:limonene 1,2-monooxygenase